MKMQNLSSDMRENLPNTYEDFITGSYEPNQFFTAHFLLMRDIEFTIYHLSFLELKNLYSFLDRLVGVAAFRHFALLGEYGE